MNKFLLRIFAAVLCIILMLPPGLGKAQEDPTSGPVYIVQEGDVLWDIAYRFHVSPSALARANGIVDTNQISVGQKLVIPGLEGIQGVLTTQEVPFGETLQSLSIRVQVPLAMLKRLNHLISPGEVYAGYSLVVLQQDNPRTPGKRVTLSAGQSLLELAILNGTDPWTLLANNQLNDSSTVLPGEIIHVRGEGDDGPGAFPSEISSISVSSLAQGQTVEIQIGSSAPISMTGSLIDHNLNFFSDTSDQYIALQGIYAMADPGLYPLTLKIMSPAASSFEFSQSVLVRAGDFLYDRSLPVDPATLDPETNRAENELWYNTASAISPEKLWDGKFSIPVDPAYATCYPSRFGSRRSYNDSAYLYFHTGLDFCGQVGYPIYAAAPGVVVFAGPLTVRGNATMIDHGRGVYTAYMHQSEVLVKVGDRVDQGELIGKVGDTGRVVGPHLHFEVLVGGVQVDPLEWLDQVFP